MTYKDGICEVCGGSDFIAGVASSGLGACSFCFCQVCLAMGAEPKIWVEAAVECCSGIENMHKDVALIYFENDQYFDFRTKEAVSIVLKDGTKFQKQSEYLAHIKSLT